MNRVENSISFVIKILNGYIIFCPRISLLELITITEIMYLYSVESRWGHTKKQNMLYRRTPDFIHII